MADSDVLYEVSERIATITINRPEARNALTSEMLERIPQRMLDAEADDDVDVIILTGTDPAFTAGPRPEGARHRRQQPGGRIRRRRQPEPLRRTRPVPDADQAADRCRQRCGGHRRTRVRTELRLPRRQRARQVRRHALARRRDARLGAHRAAPPGDRHPPSPGDELHRQLHARRRGARVRAGQPRRPPRRAAAVHPSAGARHHRQRPARRAPDPRHLRPDRHRRRPLGDRGSRQPGVAPHQLQPGSRRRPPRRHPSPRPAAVRSDPASVRSRSLGRGGCRGSPGRCRWRGSRRRSG